MAFSAVPGNVSVWRTGGLRHGSWGIGTPDRGTIGGRSQMTPTHVGSERSGAAYSILDVGPTQASRLKTVRMRTSGSCPARRRSCTTNLETRSANASGRTNGTTLDSAAVGGSSAGGRSLLARLRLRGRGPTGRCPGMGAAAQAGRACARAGLSCRAEMSRTAKAESGRGRSDVFGTNTTRC